MKSSSFKKTAKLIITHRRNLLLMKNSFESYLASTHLFIENIMGPFKIDISALTVQTKQKLKYYVYVLSLSELGHGFDSDGPHRMKN